MRRKTKDGFTEEKKVKFNLTGQRDMNCAIGGLGNDGISGTCFQSGCTVCRRSRKKYGERQCDLSHLSAKEIHAWMDQLERKLRSLQKSPEGLGGEEALDIL